MTPKRFRELTETYGAKPKRWPAAERDDALAFMKTHPVETREALAGAADLDRVLERHAVSPPSAELRERIAASAPGATPMRRRALPWWQGVGFAGLGLAGALAGALMIGVVLPIDAQDNDHGAYAVTAFNDISHELDE
jgi:hypothetical protein